MNNTLEASTSLMLLSEEYLSIPKLSDAVDTVFYATEGGPFNIRELALKVEQDKSLHQEILLLCANSYYAGRNPIRSINQAIRRLGPVGFRGIIIQAFLNLNVYHNRTWQRVLTSIQRYSKATAHACRVISQQTSTFTDLSFLLGILHRIGMSIPLLCIQNPSENQVETKRLLNAINQSYPFIGYSILHAWGMPATLLESMLYYGQIIVNNKPNKLNAILIVAEEIISHIGYTHTHLLHSKDITPSFMKDSFEDACWLLELDPNNLHSLRNEIQEALRCSSETF